MLLLMNVIREATSRQIARRDERILANMYGVVAGFTQAMLHLYKDDILAGDTTTIFCRLYDSKLRKIRHSGDSRQIKGD